MRRKRSRVRNSLARLFLVFLGFAFGALIAEAALRAVGYSYPEFYRRDPVVGVSLLPNAVGWYRREGEAYIRINSDGLRDREHALAKAPDTFRIALLGDSYCEALPVQLEDAFWSVMRNALQDCRFAGDKNIEVINFGVSGYGTAQELLTLREKVWRYSPDLILLAVTTNNDITDNSPALKKTHDVPYFVYVGDHLTLDDSFTHSRAFAFSTSRIGRIGPWLRTHSRLVQAITQGQRGLKILLASWRAKRQAQSALSAQSEQAVIPTANSATNSDQQKSADKSDLFARSEELGTDNLVYLEPNNAIWNDAWRVTEGLITEMRDEVAARGAKFVVVTLSNGPQVLPDPAVRDRFKNRFGVTDLFYPDNRIKALGAREGIPVITLAPDLQIFAQQNKVFLHGFGENIGNGHWNVAGNRAAGELIAKKLCEEPLLK